MIKKQTLYKEGAKWLYRNDQPYRQSDDDLTKRQGDEVIKIIEDSTTRNENFYLHFWFDAPHKPLEAIPPHAKVLEPTGKLTDKHKYTSMVMAMDAQVGRVLDTLDRLGIAEDTIVVFTSDNGPENGPGSAGQFRGRKRSVHEGGIRVPSLWQWKGHWGARVDDSLVMSTDMLPTFMAAANIRAPPAARFDGKNILPFLLGSEKTASVGRRPAWYTRAAAIYDEDTQTKVVLGPKKKPKPAPAPGAAAVGGLGTAPKPKAAAKAAAKAQTAKAKVHPHGKGKAQPQVNAVAKLSAATAAAKATRRRRLGDGYKYKEENFMHTSGFDLRRDKYEKLELVPSDMTQELRDDLWAFMHEGDLAHQHWLKGDVAARNQCLQTAKAKKGGSANIDVCYPIIRSKKDVNQMTTIDWSAGGAGNKTILTPLWH